MSELVDIRVIGLLSSHLCHELVNPLGAVNNGIELLMDVGDDMRDEAMALIESSAQRTAKRLQFYRMAYGMAGVSAIEDLVSVRDLTNDLLGEGRLSLEWPEADRNPRLAPGYGRALMNMVAAAAECLPRGGVLVSGVDEADGSTLLYVEARGEPARLEESTRPIYFEDVPVEKLTPRNVHAYYTVKLIAGMGAELRVNEDTEGMVKFEIRLP
jgi:histidine phosphotransferase ChpT